MPLYLVLPLKILIITIMLAKATVLLYLCTKASSIKKNIDEIYENVIDLKTMAVTKGQLAAFVFSLVGISMTQKQPLRVIVLKAILDKIFTQKEQFNFLKKYLKLVSPMDSLVASIASLKDTKK